MYKLKEIHRDGDIITAEMIPMKEIHRYENGKHIIEYISDDFRTDRNGTISCSECGTWFPKERETELN